MKANDEPKYIKITFDDGTICGVPKTYIPSFLVGSILTRLLWKQMGH
jgi:hypothetical protein